MSSPKPLLIEIGTEEIPAGVAPRMGEAMMDAILGLLSSANVTLEGVRLGVTPRRLLFHAVSCPVMQPDHTETIWGPPERIAYDSHGAPTKAAEGFARKLGITLDDCTLEDRGDNKGRYLRAVKVVRGKPVADILAEAMPDLLRKIPSPKRMKWCDGGARDDSFIRPVRWIVALLGDEIIHFTYAGVESGRVSYGHRIMGSAGEIPADDPFGWLNKQFVMADREERKQHIRLKMAETGYVDDDELLEEVTDLTEWPVPVPCSFEPDYLRLPSEVIRVVLKKHQRCFRAYEKGEKTLSNQFYAIANIESDDPAQVASGNARVVNARLADAAFYFDRDPKEPLENRVEKLNGVVFQEGLGMVGDQVRRLRGFVLDNAHRMGADPEIAQRAAYLCKSDLTTGIVGEFPELQGYMGGVYARMDGEREEVARAIEHHYTGRSNPESRAIAIAENIDKLLGYFHIGRIPTASADPFALRRAAIHLIELMSTVEAASSEAPKFQPVEMSLKEVIEESAKQWNQQRITISISTETKQKVFDFITERLLGMNWGASYSRQAIEAALGSSQDRPLYQILARARKLLEFFRTETGQAVAEVHKRTNNILKKKDASPQQVTITLFEYETEKSFFASMKAVEAALPLNNIERELDLLAGLRGPVDRFFTDVMVMVDDEAIRNNRLALLSNLRQLLLRVADFSKLGDIGTKKGGT
jgi:glycyl-tRNA synthetase beta chain